MNIVQEIRDYIEENGIKQSHVSEKTGIKADALCLTLNGKRKLPVDEYYKICVALNVPVDYFMKQELRAG